MSLQKPKVLEKSYRVSEEDAIHFLGPDTIPVLSTPSLVGCMEMACRENANSFLNVGEDTVGIFVEIKHLAPTPVGMKFRVVSTLKQIDGRIYSFDIEAFDEAEKIAEAKHQRATIAVAKFASRVAAKREKASGSSLNWRNQVT